MCHHHLEIQGDLLIGKKIFNLKNRNRKPRPNSRMILESESNQTPVSVAEAIAENAAHVILSEPVERRHGDGDGESAHLPPPPTLQQRASVAFDVSSVAVVEMKNPSGEGMNEQKLLSKSDSGFSERAKEEEDLEEDVEKQEMTLEQADKLFEKRYGCRLLEQEAAERLGDINAERGGYNNVSGPQKKIYSEESEDDFSEEEEEEDEETNGFVSEG